MPAAGKRPAAADFWGGIHETSAQSWRRLEPADLADSRRHGGARRDRTGVEHRPGLGAVLAAAQIRRFRRLRNVVLLADDGAGERRRALGRAAGLHDAAVLPHDAAGAA